MYLSRWKNVITCRIYRYQSQYMYLLKCKINRILKWHNLVRDTSNERNGIFIMKNIITFSSRLMPKPVCVYQTQTIYIQVLIMSETFVRIIHRFNTIVVISTYVPTGVSKKGCEKFTTPTCDVFVRICHTWCEEFVRFRTMFVCVKIPVQQRFFPQFWHL